MPFRPFHDVFPEIAAAETRAVTLPTADYGLPAGSYAFMELFCNERKCDCRRVFFFIVASFRQGPEAVVAWGWEPLAFYRKWLRGGDRDEARDLQGPILNLGSPETELAPALLTLVDQLLLADPEYVVRVKRHYFMFRRAIETGRA